MALPVSNTIYSNSENYKTQNSQNKFQFNYNLSYVILKNKKSCHYIGLTICKLINTNVKI